jgi:hypothetical protein
MSLLFRSQVSECACEILSSRGLSKDVKVGLVSDLDEALFSFW